MSKYKLIDILVMISKGELKEGTKVKIIVGNEEFTYKKSPTDSENHDLYNKEGESIFENYYIDVVNDEVELIEPECISNMGKTPEPADNTTEKIEELDVKTLSNIFIANDDFNKMVAFSTTLHKLNEVIRYINRRAENE